MKRVAFGVAFLVIASGCSRKLKANYKHCLALRVGMTREEMLKVMGTPEETFPFVEGKSLEHLRGRTAYEWPNPATMPGPNHVSIEEAGGKIASIRCSNVDISATVFIEPTVSRRALAGKDAVPNVENGADGGHRVQNGEHGVTATNGVNRERHAAEPRKGQKGGVSAADPRAQSLP